MKKMLIANRGEIALRIIRACHDLGLQTVAVYSEADKEALHVLHADEAVCIGKAPALQSYLNIPNILSACEITGSDAIHPGYGFLSENPKFASICESCSVTFIGPSPNTITLLGDKAKAKALVASVGCPVVPGSNGVVSTIQDAQVEAEKIGFPLIIKASAGGGGRGIRIAYNKTELEKQFIAVKTEADSCFGNDDVYLEKLISNPRHIEIQIIADKYGNCIHLGERDCTIQRRRQKLIEESPSPMLTPELREEIGRCAVSIAKAADYHTVGTVEFLLDEQGKFYFMEVNTRIQVEHTITEEITGIDLIKEQIELAQGKQLILQQSDVRLNGCAMQFRINAEDPCNNFSPSPGLVEYFLTPGGPHIRLDTACYSGYTIPPYYDSLMAKLIIKGNTREQVIARAKRALREFCIGGVNSTIPFHQFMLENETFLSGKYAINWIDTLIESGIVCTIPDPTAGKV